MTEKDTNDIKFMPKATAVATLGASIVGTALGAGLEVPGAEVTVGSRDHETTHLVSESRIVPTEHSTEVQVGLEHWARLFENDPHAGELLDDSFISGITENVMQIVMQGGRITSIDVRASSSDEDDTLNQAGQRTGGLGVQDDDGENITLAEKRSSVCAALLNEDLAAIGQAELPIHNLGGVEDILSDSEIQQIEDVALSEGYTSDDIGEAHERMIYEYNRDPASVSEGVRALLDELLKAERYCSIVINYSTNEILEESHREVRHESTPITVKIPGFMVIPVPIVRRKGAKQRSGQSSRPIYSVPGNTTIDTIPANAVGLTSGAGVAEAVTTPTSGGSSGSRRSTPNRGGDHKRVPPNTHTPGGNGPNPVEIITVRDPGRGRRPLPVRPASRNLPTPSTGFRPVGEYQDGHRMMQHSQKQPRPHNQGPRQRGTHRSRDRGGNRRG